MATTHDHRWQQVGGIVTVQPNGCLSPFPANFEPPPTYVYRIRLAERTLQRLVSRSDVLYIGKGTRGRVLGLWSGQHSAVTRLTRAAWAQSNDGKPYLHVHVECRATSQPDLYEMGLLNAFVEKHGEIPPLNGRFEGWLAPRALEALADRVVGKRDAGCRSRAYSWPRGNAACTVVDLFTGPSLEERGDWICSLVWVWPEGWAKAHSDLADLGGSLLLCQPHADGDPMPDSLCEGSYFGICGIIARCDAPELTGRGLSEDGTGGILERLLTEPMMGDSAVDGLLRRIRSISGEGR